MGNAANNFNNNNYNGIHTRCCDFKHGRLPQIVVASVDDNPNLPFDTHEAIQIHLISMMFPGAIPNSICLKFNRKQNA